MADVEMKKVKQLADGRIAIFENNPEAEKLEGSDPNYAPFRVTVFQPMPGWSNSFSTLEAANEVFDKLT